MGIIEYTNSQNKAIKMLEKGDNLLLTGKPGTGKTALLQDICDNYASLGKKVVATGSTGMAAANLEFGRTIHSTLNWKMNGNGYEYEKCVEKIKSADLLIVDEVSMLKTDIINHLINCLRTLSYPPQIIMSGDFFQLPPPKDALYPFENPNWSFFNLKPCLLEEVVRQRDYEFINMLEKAMLGDASCIDYFNDASAKSMIQGAIMLCTKNKFVDVYNDKSFNNLPGMTKIYEAQGDLTKADFNKTRVAKTLYIKDRMRVMSLRNDSQGRYQNGSLGTVIYMNEDVIRVKFDNGNEMDVERIKYYVDGNKKGNFKMVEIKQFPLAGGYAITIHKSQGQTFDYINIKAPNCWDPGQLYVALSRARDIKGIYLMDKITPDSLKADQRVIDFYNSLREISAA